MRNEDAERMAHSGGEVRAQLSLRPVFFQAAKAANNLGSARVATVCSRTANCFRQSAKVVEMK